MNSISPKTKPIFQILFFIVLLFPFGGQTVLAQDHEPVTYYISPQGNDINDGLSESRPLKDLANAIFRMKLGDTLIVLPGDYTVVDFRAWCGDRSRNKMYLGPEGGSAEIRTTIKGKRGEERPRIKALKGDGSIGILKFERGKGITLEYLNIHGGIGYGSHMVYRDCVIGGPGTVYGIGPGEHNDSVIENNYFHDIYGGSDAIGVYIHGNRNVIRNNFFKNMAHHGFQTYNASGLIIEGNIITQTNGHGIAFRDMSDSIIRNNVLVNVGSQAVSFGGTSNKNVKFVGNTIYNGDGKGYYGLFFINDVEGLVVENNLIVHRMPVTFLNPETQLAPAKIRTYTFRNNLYYNPYRDGERVFFPTNNPNEYYDVEGWREYTATLTGGEGLERDSIYGSPEVVSSPSSGSDFSAWDGSSHIDVRLTEASPAVNAGVVSPFLFEDADGNARPVGPRPDIGAYEFGGEVSGPPGDETPPAPTNLRVVDG